MSVLSERGPILPSAATITAVATVLALAIGGGVASFAGVLLFRVVSGPLGIVGTDISAVANIGVQLGFAAVAAGYLLAVDERSRYLRFSWPTAEGVAWIIALPLLSAVLSIGLSTLFSALGMAVPSHSGLGTAGILIERPALWAVAIPALYLFAAPVEELLYRGIVQGRLRPYLETSGVVLVSGVAFALMHSLTYLFSSGPIAYTVVSTGLFGLVWALVYERTENLVVTAVNHAMFWTVPFSLFLPSV